MKPRNLTRNMVFFAVLGTLIIFIGCKNDDGTATPFVTEPEFFTSDIDLFWEVYDNQNFSTTTFQTEYIDKGTIGLQDYATQKSLASGLSGKLSGSAYRNYYDAVRNNTSDLSEVIAKSEQGFDRLKEIYPNTGFLHVYFIVGSLSAGGRISENGLLIAAEMFSSDESVDLSGLNDWEQSVIRDKSFMPSIVVHELIHVQQFQHSNDGSVLDACMAEGMADFLSHKLLPDEPFMNAHLHEYGNPIEEQIWNEFEAEMNESRQGTEWLYTGQATSEGHPADMGYYMGYKIIEAYSANFTTIEEAIESILTTSYRDIFNASGYSEKFD